MNFDEFKEKCPWRVKSLRHLFELYDKVPKFKIGRIYNIGDVVLHYKAFYIRTEIKDTPDSMWNKSHWTEIASTCIATSMPCVECNCALFYTKTQILKSISLW